MNLPLMAARHGHRFLAKFRKNAELPEPWEGELRGKSIVDYADKASALSARQPT